MTTRELSVELHSEWGVASGASTFSGLTSSYLRDRHGRATITGTELTGLLAEAVRVVAAALDEGRSMSSRSDLNGGGSWYSWAERLLGGPSRYDARASEPALIAIHAVTDGAAESQDQADRAGVIGSIRPGATLSHRTGTVLPQHLRYVERARRATLSAQVELLEHDGLGRPVHWEEAGTTVWHLLSVACSLVDHLGSGRRRGSGSCTLRLADTPGAAEALETLSSLPGPPNAPRIGSPPIPRIPAGACRPEIHEDALQLAGCVHVPLMVAPLQDLHATAGRLSNTLLSSDIVSGTSILAYVHRRLCTSMDRAISDSGASQRDAQRDLALVRDAVTHDLLRCENLLPSVGGQRCLPVPLALTRDKLDSDAPLVNLLASQPAESPASPRKPLRRGYLACVKGGVRLIQPHLVGHMHTAIDRSTGTASDGDLFLVQSISAAQEFPYWSTRVGVGHQLAEVLHRYLGQDWPSALAGAARLGGRSRSQYGRVSVAVGEPAVLDPPAVAVKREEPHVSSQTTTIWLTSDLIALDHLLRPDPTPNGLCRQLNRALKARGLGSVREDSPARPGSVSASVRARRIDSYSGASHTPRPTLVALQAGSCLRVVLPHGQEDRALSELEHLGARGVGQRAAEGYGRFVVGHPLLDQSRIVQVAAAVVPAETTDGTGEGPRR